MIRATFGKDYLSFIIGKSGLGFDSKAQLYRTYSYEYDYWQHKAAFVTNEDLIHHYIGNHSISLPRYKNSKVITIDVDGKDRSPEETLDTIQTLVDYLQQDPFFIEKSVTSGGYHLYFKITNSYQSLFDFWNQFEDYFLEHTGLKIETMKNYKPLRLPLSRDYKIHGKYNSFSDNLIEHLESEDCFNLPSQAKEYPIPKDLYDNVIEDVKKERRKQSKCILTKNKVIYDKNNDTTNWNNYNYGSGGRCEMLPKIAMRCCALGMDLDDYVNKAMDCDCGSKDMAKWGDSHTIRKNIESFYSWASSQCNRYSFADYYKDSLFIKDKDKFNHVLSQDNELNIRMILNEMVFKKGKYQTKRIDAIIKLYKWILVLLDQRLFYKADYDFLNEGHLINYAFLNKLGKELNIDNPNAAFKDLVKLRLVKVIKDPVNGLSYCYKTGQLHWAKHYKATALKKFFNYFKKKLQKLFPSLIFNFSIDNELEKELSPKKRKKYKLRHRGYYSTSEACELLDLPQTARSVNKLLEEKGIFIKYKGDKKWYLTHDYKKNDYRIIKEWVLESGAAIETFYWTREGVAFLKGVFAGI